MAIKNMINTRNPGELRAFQMRMVTVGRIRLGVYATPEGKRGRPEKLDRFRFTSPDEALIRAVAELYGGEVRPWSPANDAKRKEWEVISGVAEMPVYIVNGQFIDPVYEAWAAGRTCVRRCDGEWNTVGAGEPCICNGLHPEKGRPALKDICKPTTRVQVMLQQVQGIGSWMLESHGENAAAEMSLLAGFVASAPVPVPAMLRLEFEQRREWNENKRGGPGFETREFYVPRFHISAVNARQIAVGGDALTQSLMAAGAPAALSGDTRRALEAAPVSAVPVSAPATPAPAVFVLEPSNVPGHPGGLSDAVRAEILAAIEAKTTLAELDATKAKLQERGVTDEAVRQAWRSKYNAIEAAAAALSPAEREAVETALHDRMITGTALDTAEVAHETQRQRDESEAGILPFPSNDEMQAVAPVESCCGGYRTPDEKWLPCSPCPIVELRQRLAECPGRESFADELHLYDQAVARGATHEAILLAGGPVHWLATEDQFQYEQERALDPDQTALSAAVADELAALDAANPVHRLAEAIEPDDIEDGTGPGSGLPLLPAGVYDVTEQWSLIMSRAGRRTPPLTTDQVQAMVKAAFDLPHAGAATAEQLARIAEAMKRGIL